MHLQLHIANNTIHLLSWVWTQQQLLCCILEESSNKHLRQFNSYRTFKVATKFHQTYSCCKKGFDCHHILTHSIVILLTLLID
nr:MAG TPA: hypothetical protein [Caudoviricetes sp.]